MRILGYSWVGIRTDDFEATLAFLVDTLGLPLTWRAADGEVAHFRLPSGQLFEVFGPHAAGLQKTPCRWWGLRSRMCGPPGKRWSDAGCSS
jgi:catechol 2,3-dioxygenase-like lactoylglutathione lyase family enzyme